MHHLPAWRDPHLLEGGDHDGGGGDDDGGGMPVTIIVPLGKLITHIDGR